MNSIAVLLLLDGLLMSVGYYISHINDHLAWAVIGFTGLAILWQLALFSSIASRTRMLRVLVEILLPHVVQGLCKCASTCIGLCWFPIAPRCRSQPGGDCCSELHAEPPYSRWLSAAAVRPFQSAFKWSPSTHTSSRPQVVPGRPNGNRKQPRFNDLEANSEPKFTSGDFAWRRIVLRCVILERLATRPTDSLRPVSEALYRPTARVRMRL